MTRKFAAMCRVVYPFNPQPAQLFMPCRLCAFGPVIGVIRTGVNFEEI